MTPGQAHAELSCWAPPPDLENLHEEYLRFVAERGEAALIKGLGDQHVTGSTVVFDQTHTQVLLTLHRRGQYWVQFGGHLEPSDSSIAHAARREGREESGIADLELADEVPFDLDRHDLHGGFVCARHWDVGYVAVVDADTPFAVSEESADVAWWPIAALPNPTGAGVAQRIARARAHLAVS